MLSLGVRPGSGAQIGPDGSGSTRLIDLSEHRLGQRFAETVATARASFVSVAATRPPARRQQPVADRPIGASATVVMNIWPAARKRLIGIPPLDYDGGLLACPSGARAVSPRSHCRSARTGRAPDRLDRPLFDRHRVRGHAARYLRPRQGRDNRPIGSVGDFLRDSGSNRRPKPQS
jgi:hypothetical protein